MSAPPLLTFTVSEEDAAKIAKFTKKVEAERGSGYGGSIGGATTYEFTPTGLGVIFKVKHFGQELDLTSYQDW